MRLESIRPLDRVVFGDDLARSYLRLAIESGISSARMRLTNIEIPWDECMATGQTALGIRHYYLATYHFEHDEQPLVSKSVSAKTTTVNTENGTDSVANKPEASSANVSKKRSRGTKGGKRSKKQTAT